MEYLFEMLKRYDTLIIVTSVLQFKTTVLQLFFLITETDNRSHVCAESPMELLTTCNEWRWLATKEMSKLHLWCKHVLRCAQCFRFDCTIHSERKNHKFRDAYNISVRTLGMEERLRERHLHGSINGNKCHRRKAVRTSASEAVTSAVVLVTTSLADVVRTVSLRSQVPERKRAHRPQTPPVSQSQWPF